jgi:hypothetical protein
MCDMMTQEGKGNILDLGNPISTSINRALDLSPFEPKLDREHLTPMGSLYV